ncbi:unnamed protein product [Vicia faba]|uniref:Uncharacterized protein n=1 Tax=Vicia faba TaxID=3906 RepID=A0AAV0ZZK6_VICFA|nr:unnamed protein product [Vicia faba]
MADVNEDGTSGSGADLNMLDGHKPYPAVVLSGFGGRKRSKKATGDAIVDEIIYCCGCRESVVFGELLLIIKLNRCTGPANICCWLQSWSCQFAHLSCRLYYPPWLVCFRLTITNLHSSPMNDDDDQDLILPEIPKDFTCCNDLRSELLIPDSGAERSGAERSGAADPREWEKRE